jgi:hypothetical protein
MVPPSPPIPFRRLFVNRQQFGEKATVFFGLFVTLVGIYFLFFVEVSNDTTVHFFNFAFSAAKLFAFAIFLFGVFMAVVPYSVSLQSVVLYGDKLIFSYRFKKKVYTAKQVKQISWKTGLYYTSRKSNLVIFPQKPLFPGDLGPSGDIGGNYGRYTALLVQMENGKSEEIPAAQFSKEGIKAAEVLLEWNEKYDPAPVEDAAG